MLYVCDNGKITKKKKEKFKPNCGNYTEKAMMRAEHERVK